MQRKLFLRSSVAETGVPVHILVERIRELCFEFIVIYETIRESRSLCICEPPHPADKFGPTWRRGQSDEPKREDRECRLTDALQQTGNPSGRMCDIDELEMTFLIDATAAAKPHVTGFLVIYVAP